LNSLWGRFSLRNNLSKSKIIENPAEFLQLLDDYTIEIAGIEQLNEEAILVTWITKDEYIVENPTSSIVISLWTTSAARCKLYEYMKKVHESGAKLLYTDTGKLL
jgi:hypothetical protein